MAKKTQAQIEFKAVTSGFDSGIKSMDQSLTTLRKELNLNSAQLKENGDDVDLLAQRQELLQKESEASANKIDLLKNKLSEAERMFGSNSNEVRQLSNRLLDFQTTHQKIQNEIVQTDNKLNDLENGLSDVNQGMKKADDSTDNLSDGFTTMKGVVADLVADGIQALSGALKDLVVDSDTAMSSFQAQTGASTDEMKEFESAIENIYSNNFGESINDIANAMAEVKQQTKETDPSNLQKMTEHALTLRDMDVKESMRAVNSLMNQFGLDGTEAFNLIVQGAQNGLNANDDLLDTINEYSVQFKNAGYSADDMLNMLYNGAETGTWSIDKLGDAVKEMNIRFSDGTVSDALKENQKALGLTKKEVSDLTTEFNKGGENSKQAIQKVIDSIMSVEDETERYKLGVSVFGTMWEDLGAETISSLMSTKGEITSTKQSMEELTQVKYDNITSELSEIGRTIKMDILVPIGEELLPILKDGLSWLKDNLNWLLPTITGIGIALATYFVVSKFMSFIGVITQIINLVKTGTTVMGALNTVMALNPIALIVGAVVGLIAVFVLLWNKCDGFREFWINLWETIKNALSVAWEWIKEKVSIGVNFVSDIITTVFTAIKNFFSTVWEAIKNVVTTVWNAIINFITPVINTIKDVITNVFNAIKNTITTIFNGIKTFASNVWEGIKTVIINPIKNAFNTVKTTVGNIKDNVVNTFNNVKEKVTSVFNKVKEAIWKPVESAKEKVKGIVDKIKGFFDFEFKLPKIKTPKFSITPKGWKIGDLLDGSIPKLGITWNAKGGIFKKPTILNSNNGLQGVSEAGAEAILPLQRLEDWINNGFSRIINNNYYASEKIERLIEVAEDILNKSSDVYINKEKVGQVMAETNDNISGQRVNFKRRGVIM